MIKKKPEGFNNISLDNCFQNFQKEIIYTGENKFYCDNYKKISNGTTRNKIITSPEVMTIILKKGKCLEFDLNFEYPLFLNIDQYVMDKACNNNNYELIGILTQDTPCEITGHLVAFCKSPIDKKWYYYNVTEVSEIDDPRHCQVIPYVLFYQKYILNDSFNNNYYKEKYSQNIIILNFQYNNKEVFLEVKQNTKIKDLIKKLNIKYNFSKNILLYFQIGDNFDILDKNKTVNDYNLKNETKLFTLDDN